MYRRCPLVFNDVESVATPLEIVTLAGHHLAMRLAILLIERRLLPTNPS